MKMFLLSLSGALFTMISAHILASFVVKNAWEAVIIAPFFGVVILFLYIYLGIKTGVVK